MGVGTSQTKTSKPQWKYVSMQQIKLRGIVSDAVTFIFVVKLSPF